MNYTFRAAFLSFYTKWYKNDNIESDEVMYYAYQFHSILFDPRRGVVIKMLV